MLCTSVDAIASRRCIAPFTMTGAPRTLVPLPMSSGIAFRDIVMSLSEAADVPGQLGLHGRGRLKLRGANLQGGRRCPSETSPLGIAMGVIMPCLTHAISRMRPAPDLDISELN